MLDGQLAAALSDPSNTQRFTQRRDKDFLAVIAELLRRRKRSHWMWFVFPRLGGLEVSSVPRFFTASLDQACAYLANPVFAERASGNARLW